MAEREETVRKVYVLPTELVERINLYKEQHHLDSEVEAVRRLLDIALLHRDSTISILGKMLSRFKTEKDLRVLARDILSTHPLVDSINYFPGALTFSVKDDQKAAFDRQGTARVFFDDDTAARVYLDKDGRTRLNDDDIPF
ncbi:hypothetical protein [Methylobacterium brachiatum]|uniref:hypothetical protein n=1 Tax=Methylobacterium brachiatum TaxID=269660 RepID=UPI0011138F56|nr:hypothetical protein [Methylobacterium brachiatum]